MFYNYLWIKKNNNLNIIYQSHIKEKIIFRGKIQSFQLRIILKGIYLMKSKWNKNNITVWIPHFNKRNKLKSYYMYSFAKFHAYLICMWKGKRRKTSVEINIQQNIIKSVLLSRHCSRKILENIFIFSFSYQYYFISLILSIVEYILYSDISVILILLEKLIFEISKMLKIHETLNEIYFKYGHIFYGN